MISSAQRVGNPLLTKKEKKQRKKKNLYKKCNFTWITVKCRAIKTEGGDHLKNVILDPHLISMIATSTTYPWESYESQIGPRSVFRRRGWADRIMPRDYEI